MPLIYTDHDLLTYEQVGLMLQCSKKTVYRRVKAGLLKALYDGGLVRFDYAEVRRYKESLPTEKQPK